MLFRSGDVIPEVVRAIKERRNGSEKEFFMDEKCPVCGEKLTKVDAMHFCLNEKCLARNIEQLIHFCSKECMDIDGMGDKVVEQFFNQGFIKDIPSIYEINNFYNDILEIDGWREKSINNLLNAVEKSKSNSLERLIVAFGIDGVGSKTAKTLSKIFHTMDSLISVDLENLLGIPDVGPVVGNSVIEFFKKESNIEMINKLKSYNVNMT